MELRQLKYFIATAEYGSFSAAAHYLSSSQSAVSQQISKLEKELDSSLFDRVSHGCDLTAAGKCLLIKAKSILEIENQILKCFKPEKSHEIIIRVGAPPSIAPFMIPELFKMIKHDYPQIHLKIIENNETKLIDLLNEKELDIIFTSATNCCKNQCKILTEPLQLIYSKTEHYTSLPTKAIDLKQFDIVMLAGEPSVSNTLKNSLGEDQFSKLNISYVEQIETLYGLIDKQLGIGILPNMAMQYASTTSNRILEASPPLLRDVYLCIGETLDNKTVIDFLYKKGSLLCDTNGYVPDESAFC